MPVLLRFPDHIRCKTYLLPLIEIRIRGRMTASSRKLEKIGAAEAMLGTICS
jgi:hypothetical protein